LPTFRLTRLIIEYHLDVTHRRLGTTRLPGPLPRLLLCLACTSQKLLDLVAKRIGLLARRSSARLSRCRRLQLRARLLWLALRRPRDLVRLSYLLDHPNHERNQPHRRANELLNVGQQNRKRQ
jgi:hypothetical protein